MKPADVTKLSMKKAAELMHVDRAVIAELARQGCPRNANGTINLYKLTAWLLLRTKGDAIG